MKYPFPLVVHVVALAFGLLELTAVSVCAAPGAGSLCDRAASDAAVATGVPIDILLAIARVETGRVHDGTLYPWPWTINADGKGTFYDTADDAITAAQAHLTDGTGTFDIGCFQINVHWHGEAFTTFHDMFDPGKNADYAARFLMSLYRESGSWADAVAAYHSRSPDLANAYLDQVKAMLASKDEYAQTGSSRGNSEPKPRENNFPLLQTGSQGSIGSLVPLTLARGRLIGGNS